MSTKRLSVKKIAGYSRKVKNKIELSFGVDRKIFNLSLHRSGTQSTWFFLKNMGFSSQHWPGADFDNRCEPFLETLDTAGVWDLYRPFVKMHSSFHDVPMPFLYDHIIRDFPDALYMIVVRRPSAWIRSVRELMKDRELTVMERFLYWRMFEIRRTTIAEYTDDELEYGYLKFISDVTNSMVASRANFRIFNLESPDLASSIAEFCGITHSIPPFLKIDWVGADLSRRSDQKS